jgi:hypothetical protein
MVADWVLPTLYRGADFTQLFFAEEWRKQD